MPSHATSSNGCSTKRCSTRRRQYAVFVCSRSSTRSSASSIRTNRRLISLPTSEQRNASDMKWDCVCNHFEKFCGGKCTFGDITVELCEKFRDYLLKCKQIHLPNSYISRNSAAGYYSTFRALLKIAYKEKMLRENLNDFLEKIEWKEVKK